MRTTNGRNGGFALSSLVSLVLLAAVVVAGFYWWTSRPAEAAVATTPVTVEPARVEWGAKVEVGNATKTTVPAPTPTVDESDALRAELEIERAGRQAAESQLATVSAQLASEQRLNQALSRLATGEKDQARADLHVWAGQVQGYGDALVVKTPLPEEAVSLLNPVFVVNKHHDTAGDPYWVVKRTRDDRSLARLR